MNVRFEHPGHRREPVSVDLPQPPREGEWVSLGDEDDQYLVRTVVWHTHAEDGEEPWVQIILRES